MTHNYSFASLEKLFMTVVLFFIVGTAQATTQTVNTQNIAFIPASFSINLGDTVKWVWLNGLHTTTSLTIPVGATAWNHALDGTVGNVQFIYVPTVTGTYNYQCNIHLSLMPGSFTVVCPTPSLSISAGGPITFCSGGSVVLSKSSVPNFSSYQWKKNGVNISGETTTSTTATTAGSYTLVATNSCGSTGTSNPISVTVNTAPTTGQAAISAGGPTTFCTGGNVVLTVATAGLTYQWKNGGVTISGATLQSFTASATGVYTCAVSNSCGTTISNTILVVVNAAPTTVQAAITAGGATTFCSGGNVALTVATAGLIYQWKNGGSVIPGATSQSFTASATGSYTCDVSNSCGTTTSNAIAVTVNTAPTSGEAGITAGGATTFCSGGNVALTVATAGLSYQWKNGGSTISGETNQSFTASAAGSYTCDVTNSCGTTTSNAIAVTVNTAPTSLEAAITAGGPTTFCNGGNVILTVTTAGLTYQWKDGGSTISGETNQSFTASAAGSYTCDVTNSCGTTTSNAIAVTVNTAPTSLEAAITAGGATTFCSGGNVVLTAATAGLTYQWKNGGSTISGETNQSITASAAGSYTCDVSNSCGTTTSNAIAVTVNTAPTSLQAAITAGGATTFCSGGNVVLTVATAGLTYQWKNGGSTIPGATNQSFTATVSGSYTCDVSNSCGPTTSNAIVVTANTAPTVTQAAITAGGPTSFCKGGSVVLTVATAGLTYQWKKGTKNLNGFTQQSYTSKATATYKCDVSNSCGTTTSNSIATTSNPAPTATISQAPCSGHAILLTCTANPGTGVTFQWKKGNMTLSGATNSTYSATVNATYKCTVTITASGCTKASAGSSVTITCKSGDAAPDNTVMVYPNPTSDYFNINTAQLNPQSVLYIYDLTGRLVESYKVSGGDMKIGKALSNGVYFLKIDANNETQQVIKLVKNF